MNDQEVKELRVIEKLLVLQLLKQEVSPSKIADALGMSHAKFNEGFGIKKSKEETD